MFEIILNLKIRTIKYRLLVINKCIINKIEFY